MWSEVTISSHADQFPQITIAVEEWQPGYHRSLSDMTNASACLHVDEIRESAMTVLENIYGENKDAWVKFSHRVHSTSAQSGW